MENNPVKGMCSILSERRLVLIGERWAGKSYSGNTILRKVRFECGRTRTPQSEVRHELVEGRQLTVVDAPGWSGSLSLTEIPAGDKLRFKLNAYKCPPGPHAFLLVVPIDCAFSAENRRTVEEHMKLLGERVWRNTMVLFTCGDYLGGKTIEQHIESEGAPLKWLVGRCGNRYHVVNNKERGDASQVMLLLQKIDEMVRRNDGGYYEVDEKTLKIIKEKQREVAERAGKRRRRAEEQRQQMKSLNTDKTIPNLNMILLGSRSVGKTTVGNAILGIKEQEDGKRTAHSVAQQGFVGETEVTLVDTPGWWKGLDVLETPEALKDEVKCSMFHCPPGPHVFLLVIDADASFNAKHLAAATTHVELLGEEVWRRVIVVFTRGDWLGTRTIEEFIEGEGEALQTLIERCGDRYHVVNNKNADASAQELLENIGETVVANGWDHVVPDEKIFLAIEERRRLVEEGAMLRQRQIEARRKSFRDSRKKSRELTILMLGQVTFGKSATGNNLLRKEVFATCKTERCHVEEGEVAGRLVTVIDTPGWREDSYHCTEEKDKEIVRGLSLRPSGVHCILLVIPLDLTFREAQRAALENHVSLFGASVWKHVVVLFTYGDNLADESVEEHIEREHGALRWLIDVCENRYHVMNNMRRSDASQVAELFEKIDEVVAGNGGRLFCPKMSDVCMRVDEKFRRRQLKHVLKQRLGEEYRRRELELMTGFKETLLELQADIKGSGMSLKPKLMIGDMSKLKAKGFGQRKKGGTEEDVDVNSKISQKIKKLEEDITMKSEVLQSSVDHLRPDLKTKSPAPSSTGSIRKTPSSHFDKVLGWLSTLEIGTNDKNQMTLDFSETSGYRSVLPHGDEDFDTGDES